MNWPASVIENEVYLHGDEAVAELKRAGGKLVQGAAKDLHGDEAVAELKQRPDDGEGPWGRISTAMKPWPN